MKGKGVIRLIIALLVIAGAVTIAAIGIDKDKTGSINDIKLGLDLAGGVSITYEAVAENPSSQSMEDTVSKMQKRAESFSTEAEVYPEGDRRVVVAIPDVTDADSVLEKLGSAGNIYFVYGMAPDGTQNIEGKTNEATGEFEFKLLRSLDEIIADGHVVIEGADITDAQPNVYQDNLQATQYVVDLVLNEKGKTSFEEATRYAAQYRNDITADVNYRNLIAIVYDNEVVSAPGVVQTISGGKAQISGQKDYDEAKILASTIRIGALPVELSVLRYEVVGAQLGAEAIETSLLAGAIGFILVVLFMIIFYRIPGLASAFALVFYVALMIICLNIFNVTLTLPGVAGIILSIGMAVDANVIIFTRIKEELAVGKTVRSSIKLGFSKALSAIVDGNVTTILAAVVLYFLGSGTVKGFAQTLAIGIILSMITALFVTRFILSSLFDIGADSVKCYGIKNKGKVIQFTKYFKRYIFIPAVIIVAGIVALCINKANTGEIFNYGLEFQGGTATTITFTDGLPENIQSDLEHMVYDTVGEKAQITIAKDDNIVTIKTKELQPEARKLVTEKLINDFGVTEEYIQTNSVGSTVSSEMKEDAVIAVIVATIGMLLYIWFRFKNIKFALSSVSALIHDVLVVLVVYAIGRSFISVGNTFIACMLTIVGYSINATIVVFDRIRESLKERTKKESLADVVNQSITQTLSRSINTSLTTFIMVFLIAIMGVTSVQEFAFPLIAGIIAGGFSSVCLAGCLWYNMHKKAERAK